MVELRVEYLRKAYRGVQHFLVPLEGILLAVERFVFQIIV